MEIRAIRTEKQYSEALTILEGMANDLSSENRERFDVLSILVEAYERKKERLATSIQSVSTSSCELVLNSGRTIYLESLKQERVYRGLGAGLPTRLFNQRLVNALVEKTTKPTLLIRPEQEPFPDNEERPWFFGEPYLLPKIECTGQFKSYSHARDPSMPNSTLTCVWFQKEFAFPIAPEVLVQIQAMDWDALANDYDPFD